MTSDMSSLTEVLTSQSALPIYGYGEFGVELANRLPRSRGLAMVNKCHEKGSYLNFVFGNRRSRTLGDDRVAHFGFIVHS